MTAEELRLGNLVKDHLGRIQTVSEIREDSYICYLSNGKKLKYKLNTTKPIQLTEEWLLKFGFEKIDDFDYWGLKGLVIRYYYTYKWCSDIKHYEATIMSELNQVGVPFKYVHQLQNLYFSLTGEELKLKKQ